MLQSRAFHETCELKLPNEAATIPEVLLFLSPKVAYSDLTSTAANTLSQHNETKCFSTLRMRNQSSP